MSEYYQLCCHWKNDCKVMVLSLRGVDFLPTFAFPRLPFKPCHSTISQRKSWQLLKCLFCVLLNQIVTEMWKYNQSFRQPCWESIVARIKFLAILKSSIFIPFPRTFTDYAGNTTSAYANRKFPAALISE